MEWIKLNRRHFCKPVWLIKYVPSSKTLHVSFERATDTALIAHKMITKYMNRENDYQVSIWQCKKGPSMLLIVVYHHHFIPTFLQSSWMNAWFILLHRNTHVVSLSIKPGIYHLYHAGLGLARPQTALLWPVVQEKYTHPMPHKPALRSRALRLRSWGKIYCCRFSLILDVRLGSPLNAGKIEGKT